MPVVSSLEKSSQKGRKIKRRKGGERDVDWRLRGARSKKNKPKSLMASENRSPTWEETGNSESTAKEGKGRRK